MCTQVDTKPAAKVITSDDDLVKHCMVKCQLAA
jgi:hypothetical protein